MPISKHFLPYDPTFQLREVGDVHALTFAETGFAMLSIYAHHQCGISPDTLREFADRVNARNEVGTLVPHAPISAVPRHMIREPEAVALAAKANLADAVREFFRANRTHANLRSRRILFDFVASTGVPLAGFILPAILEAVSDEEALPEQEQVVQEAFIVSFLNETEGR